MNVLPAFSPYPAPFNLPPGQRPAPLNVPRQRRPAPFTNVETDVDRIFEALDRIPELSAAGPMVWLNGPSPGKLLPAELGRLHLVHKDKIAALVVQEGEALCASGLPDTELLVAQGANAMGQAVIAMANMGGYNSAAAGLAAIRDAMAGAGAMRYSTMVLGGELSRDPESRGAGIFSTIAIATAARREGTLVCGRVGVTQTNARTPAAQARTRLVPAWPGLPDTKICAVLTAGNLYYAAEDDDGPTLFDADRAIPIGVAISRLARPCEDVASTG
jgi:hypothetical protein